MASPVFDPIPALTGKNEEAQREAARIAGDLITGISEEIKLAIRAVIVKAIADGLPPAAAARLVRTMIGMNAAQTKAALRYREGLIESGLSQQRVEMVMERYVAKKVRERAKTIARTEIMRALNKGQLAVWLESLRLGLLGPRARKRWMTVPDEVAPDPCDECEPLNGTTAKLDEPFASGDYEPPAHPNCRCTMQVIP